MDVKPCLSLVVSWLTPIGWFANRHAMHCLNSADPHNNIWFSTAPMPVLKPIVSCFCHARQHKTKQDAIYILMNLPSQTCLPRAQLPNSYTQLKLLLLSLEVIVMHGLLLLLSLVSCSLFLVGLRPSMCCMEKHRDILGLGCKRTEETS